MCLKGSSLVEVGSSWGYFLWQAKNQGFDVTGVEIGEKRRLFGERHLEVKIVDDIKKRIELRPDPSISVDPEKAEKIIKSIIPKEAGVANVTFDPNRSRVIIETEKPGLAIGKQGSILREIRKKTLYVRSGRRRCARSW